MSLHMGTGEMSSFSKMLEQPQPPTVTGTVQFSPEWAAFQAYYTSGMTSIPPPNPYMWGAQPMMPPYGPPPPFTSIYSHRGMYAHPSPLAGNHPYSPYGLTTGNTREVPGALVPAGLDAEGKSKYANAKSPSKKSNVNSGNFARLTSKGEDAQTGGPSGFGSYSAESGSEGSTEGSQENCEFGATDQHFPEAPNGGLHNVNHNEGTPISTGGKHCASAEVGITLNNWNGGTGLLHAGGQSKHIGSAAMAMALTPSTNILGHTPDRAAGELGLQDERELKRQRRKQSNRESARRSRLRKQVECEELAAQVEALSKENKSLREKLDHVIEECRKLSDENCSLLDRLQRCRPEDVNGEMEKKSMLNSKSVHKVAKIFNDNISPAGSSHVDCGVNLKGFAAFLPRDGREEVICDTFGA